MSPLGDGTPRGPGSELALGVNNLARKGVLPRLAAKQLVVGFARCQKDRRWWLKRRPPPHASFVSGLPECCVTYPMRVVPK